MEITAATSSGLVAGIAIHAELSLFVLFLGTDVDRLQGRGPDNLRAVANTVMGVLQLLMAGAVSDIIAHLDTWIALAFLAGLAVIVVLVGQSLRDVSKGDRA